MFSTQLEIFNLF